MLERVFFCAFYDHSAGIIFSIVDDFTHVLQGDVSKDAIADLERIVLNGFGIETESRSGVQIVSIRKINRAGLGVQ